MESSLNQSQKIKILQVVLGGLFLAALDQTIVTPAAPKIVAELEGMNRYTWLATAYLLASTALVPIYGKLADTNVIKKATIAAYLFFILGSLLCGIAGLMDLSAFGLDKMDQLIFARAIQGIGGAGLFTMAFVTIADLFPPAVRGKYQGYTSAVFALASILGPSVGGVLSEYGNGWITDFSGWRWIFLLNIPLGFFLLSLYIKKVPQPSYKKKLENFDYLSSFWLISGITSLLLGIEELKGGQIGLLSGLFFLYALLAIGLFCYRSYKSTNPLLYLGLFKNSIVKIAVVALFLTGGVFVGFLIFEPLYEIQVLQVSSTKAGMSLLLFSGGVVLGALFSGKMVNKTGNYKQYIIVGLLFLMLSLFSLIYFDPNYTNRLYFLFFCGLGFGPIMPLYSLAVQNAVEKQYIGQATSSCQFFRQIGGVIITAILGIILVSYTANVASVANYKSVIHLVYIILLVLTGLSLLITFFLKLIPLRTK